MFHTSVTQAICINARGHAELHALPGSYCSAFESSTTDTLIQSERKVGNTTVFVELLFDNQKLVIALNPVVGLLT